MLRGAIIADRKEQITRLGSELISQGLICSIDICGERAAENISHKALDILLVAVDGKPGRSETMDLASDIRRETGLPVIALLSRQGLYGLDAGLIADDFVVEPWDATEVAARAKRIIGKRGKRDDQVIRCGDLVIDLAKYDVSVNGRAVALTFREYELLKFLVSNEGRVFTRDELLNEVWGYDYYGGDRTVDVHIRRLRGKIEDSAHTFIETVRNIGYRFKASSEDSMP